jgi:DNA repair protein SbcC/Rad50
VLEELLLQDFQNHTRTILKFGPGVNTLVGDTGTGKSAVVRALKWLSFNKPAGSSFVGRWGKAEFALVGAKIDGHKILHKRGAGTNEYRLDGQPLLAFKTDPPAAVVDLLNLGPTNFQFQHDAAFLLSLSAPQVGRELNAVINLETIDRVLRDSVSETREAKTAVAVSADRLSTAKERADSLAWVVSMDQRLAKLETLDSGIRQSRANCDKLAQDLTGIEKWAKIRQRASEAVQHGFNAIQVAQEINKIAERINTIKAALTTFAGFDQLAAVELPNIEELNQFQADYEKQQQKVRSLESVLSGLAQLEYATETADMEYESAREQYRKASKICPTCKRPL